MFRNPNKSLYILIAFVFVIVQCTPVKHNRLAHAVYEQNKTLTTKQGMVVTAHPEASKIGLDILKKGGNAIDAAIGVQFALAVCYPIAGNIGGGGFMVFRDKKGAVTTLDFREKAPLASTETMYQDSTGSIIPGLSTLGHLAVGVPGTVDGMVQAFEKYSALKDWKALVQPSVDLAKNGFKLTVQQAENLNGNHSDFKKANSKETVFTSKHFKAGDILKQVELSRTLEAIRDNKRSGFYDGWVAQALVNSSQTNGGIITQADLDKYDSKWIDPITFSYKDYTIHSMPPPSSGGILLHQLFKSVESFPFKSIGFHNPKAIHLIVEAERRAYADRAKHLGDMDFYNVPVDSLTTEAYIKKRMASFDPEKASKSSSIAPGTFKESDQTTHFSIVDKDRNAVSITTTLNGAYGSSAVVENAGFLLNNEMDDFSAKKGHANLYGLIGGEANKIEPEKRMLSSMSPTIVERDGDLYMVVGTPGGSTIITSVFQTILNVIEYGMTVDQAVQSPRFHHQWKPDKIYYEQGSWNTSIKDDLKQKGHTLQERSPIGRVEAILIQDQQLHGAADTRGDDDARGY